MQKKIQNHLLSALVVWFLSFVLVAIIFEGAARICFKGTAYVPGKEILNGQKYLKPDDKVGYLWKENISWEDDIRLTWRDQKSNPLSTDEFGFLNHPSAIKKIKKNHTADVIGLGDSFVHDAAYIFYEKFSKKNKSYYNLAMPRHCPPQYNIILKNYAISLKPGLIIYGVYENDFDETRDFFSWKKSGLDWFFFHSGTWCGPSLSQWKIFRTYFPGTYAFYRAVRKSFLKVSETPKIEDIRKVAELIKEANDIARGHNARFILLLIPDKRTLESKKAPGNYAYNQLESLIKNSGVETIDLRKFFEKSDIPKYYYKIDNHWNEDGIDEAFSIIEKYLKNDNVN